ncbi:helicase-related protein [Massilia sp. DD77]|uniref:helicase-related protein n=1 Tax=Massilia sp. DD77 TaxID=3109349 RepID=UPI003000D4F3
MSGMDDTELRDAFVAEIRSRLIGPGGAKEVLHEKPHKRYLSGMVFPQGATAGKNIADERQDGEDPSMDEDEDEDAPESPTDMLFQKLPASVGMTFALATNESKLTVQLRGAAYSKGTAEVVAVSADRRKRKGPPVVWTRKPLPSGSDVETVVVELPRDGARTREPIPVLEGMAELRVYVRLSGDARIATVALVNRNHTPEDTAVNAEHILFQVEMTCAPSLGVPAYPDPPRISPDPEAEELALQYRDTPAFAVGHGCGVYWSQPEGDVVSSVAVDFLPSVEVPPVTTEIRSLPDNVAAALSMKRLQDPSFDPITPFRDLIQEYTNWRDGIATLKLDDRFEPARERIVERIDAVIERMTDGVDLLEDEPGALEVFRLANRSMLISLARAARNQDRKRTGRFQDVNLASLADKAVVWRPFQIAFFLISLRGLWEPEHDSRDIVDLIWFPTGGGKTEAYLGVAAFEMIRRRLMDPERGGGTAVIKRYTLRLLTIQQFERAGGLICALETMRQAGDIETSHPFSLGLWVGGDSAPNTGAAALEDLDKIHSSAGRVDGVKVPLKQCPVCSKPIIPENKAVGTADVGLRAKGNSVELFCSDRACPFHGGLPISYVDDDLYASPPTLLLGTVDKFAMLAWRHEARAFFGTDSGMAPPSLIIQDELHLISGPLGTLAGIYEAAIDRIISELGAPAKYICATATIRRSDDQIEKLYGRRGALFPPAGISAGNSFFSRTSTDPKQRGRLYLGAMGQGHTPTFSNVIASSALLSAGGVMRAQAGDQVDTWWTVVAYHNSKRELGKTLSLARDDIPGRLDALGEQRKVTASRVSELSANLKDSEIPEALHRLSVELPDSHALDYVACTNMLSVGVDVSRLGLMLVNGQPKTVSEYIQASSRVGRSRNRPPGIVFTLFSPTKPRDRSHYEFFRHFHKGFYRYVEPTSVTPFAMPAQQRGLHGAFLALVRMVSQISANNHAAAIRTNAPEVRRLADVFCARIEDARDGKMAETRRRLDDFIDDWMSQANEHGSKLRFQSGGKEHPGLIKAFRKPGTGIETLQSLRNVDVPLKLDVPIIESAGA